MPDNFEQDYNGISDSRRKTIFEWRGKNDFEQRAYGVLSCVDKKIQETTVEASFRREARPRSEFRARVAKS